MIGLTILSCQFPSADKVQNTIENQIQASTSIPVIVPTTLVEPTIGVIVTPTFITEDNQPNNPPVSATSETTPSLAPEPKPQSTQPTNPTLETRSKTSGKEYAYDDYVESSGCPQGLRCITSGSFAWPSAAASYCIAPAIGMNIDGKTIWGDADIDLYATNAAR